MTQDFLDRPSGAIPLPAMPADFEAFHELYRAHYINWAELYLGTRADAEEAVDHAFEQLALSWPDVLARENPSGYAWVVMKNRTIDLARSRGRRPTVTDTAAFDTIALHQAVDPIGELVESLHIYQAIRALPERQHDVIVLRHCLDRTVTETADILGISEPAVRSTARYARRRLKEMLGTQEKGNADDLTR